MINSRVCLKTMDYYKISFDDQETEGWELVVTWELPDGSWRDVWAYTRCEYLSQPDDITVDIVDKGLATDFNLANFNIPIVSKRLGDVVESVAKNQIQRIPISIGDDRGWEILNILNLVECLDYERSVIDYHAEIPSDPAIVETLKNSGKPRGVRLLRIDGRKACGFHIFRISDWTIPIIVSAALKNALEDAGVTGLSYRSIS